VSVKDKHIWKKAFRWIIKEKVEYFCVIPRDLPTDALIDIYTLLDTISKMNVERPLFMTISYFLLQNHTNKPASTATNGKPSTFSQNRRFNWRRVSSNLASSSGLGAIAIKRCPRVKGTKSEPLYAGDKIPNNIFKVFLLAFLRNIPSHYDFYCHELS